MNKKYKDYSFWMSVSAAVVLVINNLAKAFGFKFDNEIFTQIVDSVCGVLVVLGILTMSTKDKKQNDDSQKNTEQNKDTENKDDKQK